MNPNETSVNGLRLVYYKEQPGTSTVNSVESTVPNPFSNFGDDQQLFNMTALDSAITCKGPCICGIFCRGVAENEGQLFIDPPLPSFTELQEQPCLSDSWNDILPSPVGTELDYGSSLSMVSYVSTFTCPTVSSTPEQGEFEETEGLNSMGGASHAKSVFAPIGDNIGSCINVTNPGDSVLSAELSIPGSIVGCCRTCKVCLWPASACHGHRLPASEDEMRKFFKGVKKKKNSHKWTCEIRISTKIKKDSKLRDKLWFGTFDTPVQAARALHVGRFLLSAKKKPPDTAIFDLTSKNILSEFKDLLLAQPLDAVLLQKVKKLAIDYGKNDAVSFFDSVNNEAVGIPKLKPRSLA